ncbi:MAG TPA: sigma-70 family RNA polymerase sigma factor [Burkholderiaceae bacterium]|nr:sigma-70 family RNA polymerase sigma factor [Burkholderiaceae bacterium]
MTHRFFDYPAHMHAIAHGDHHAFVRLYRQESPRMLALAQRMLGRKTEARDVVRDTFVLIWKHAESCDTSDDSARAWMYGVLRHRIMSVRQQPGRIAPEPETWTDYLPDIGSDATRTGPVYQALHGMDRRQRQPLLVAYYHGCGYRQIATRLGSTVDQVRRQIRQTLRVLSGRLQR